MQKEQTTLKKAGMSQPAKPALSRESRPLNSEAGILEITENHDWLQDFDVSDG